MWVWEVSRKFEISNTVTLLTIRPHFGGDVPHYTQMHAQGEAVPASSCSTGAPTYETPARKDWHVERSDIIDSVYDTFRGDGRPQVLGLVGDSGSGKTTVASQIVRSKEVLEFFCDGIVWLSIGVNAKDRLPALIQHVSMSCQSQQGTPREVGPAPTPTWSEQLLEYVGDVVDGTRGRKNKCLVVADDVCDGGVVAELQKTGVWILMTTRYLDLVVEVDGKPLLVDKLSQQEAYALLGNAAEVPHPLPTAAGELVELCGRSPLDLEYVARWSDLRRCADERLWSEAAAQIRQELSRASKAKVRPKVNPNSRTRSEDTVRRVAIFLTGLALGQGNSTQQDLYLAAAIMPDEHVFSMEDVYALVHNEAVADDRGTIASTGDNEQALEAAVAALEHWGVLDARGKGTFSLPKACAADARERLLQREDLRQAVITRWTEHISSLRATISHDVFALVRLWNAVERVGGDGWRRSRPYEKALAKLDKSDATYLPSVEAVALLHEVEGDHEGAAKVMQRVLDAHKAAPGTVGLLHVASALRVSIDSVASSGREKEEAHLRRQLEGILDDPSMDRWKQDDGSGSGSDSAGDTTTMSSLDYVSSLFILALCSSTTGRNKEAESLCRRALASREEAKLSPEHPRVAFARHMLGCCMREKGQAAEAEKHFRLALEIEEARLGEFHVMVAVTLYELGRCIREDGRPKEAEPFYRRALEIEEAKKASDDGQVAFMLYGLGRCVWEVRK